MPPMKISGVDRCGCLIQSARLESSDLHYNTTSTNVDATVAFNLPFDSLSTSYHNRMWLWARANPIRLGRVPVLYLFVGPFFSLLFLRFLRFSVFLSLSFAFPSFFFIPVLPALMTVGCSRENLSQGKDSLLKGVVIGSPGCFDLLTPHPFLHSRRHRRQLNVSFLTNSKAARNSRKYRWKIDSIVRSHADRYWNISWCIIWRVRYVRRIFFEYQ